MKKYKVKPYHSYYHYKKQKLMKQRLLIMSILMLTIIIVLLFTDKLQKIKLPDFFHNISQEASSTENHNLYLAQDDVMYGLFTQPTKVKGIYIPASKVDQLDKLIQFAEDTEVNSFIIDVKNDYGYLSFNSSNTLLKQMGCVREKPQISDINNVMDTLYNANIYPIARIVAFKDNVIGKQFPDRVIQDKAGKPYLGSDGQMWLNPYDERNWEYLLEVCKEAIQVGFKEIQFDYIRFHESMNNERVDLPNDKSKTQIITAFTKYMYEHLKPYGVYISADVFGTIITSSIDAQTVGQDYKELIKYLDYISPMIYPSHYAKGSFGVEYPDLQPYDIILGVMQASNQVIKQVPRSERTAQVRPWLQDFTATWVTPHQLYGDKQVREQIQATYDSMVNQWILWNAGANYSQGGLEKE